MNHNYLVAWILVLSLVFAGFAGATPARARTIFNVNSTVDAVDAVPGDGLCETVSGECTLRAAIQEANALAGADSIRLPEGTYTLTLGGSDEDLAATGDLDITEELTITGMGSPNTIIDGGGHDRVFDIQSVSVAITGVTIRNGNAGADNGGAIANTGALFLTDGQVTGNRAAAGGGLSNVGLVTLTASTVSGNTSDSFGGGIYNVGLLALVATTVSDNTGVGSGGGISNFGLGYLTFSRVMNNEVAGAGGGLSNAGISWLAYSEIRANETTGLLGTGGGIYNIGMLTTKNSTIDGNFASLSGGGLSISSGSTVTITASTISSNSAAWHGGGIFHSTGSDLWLVNSTLSGNLSARDGGGIANNGSLDLSNVTITGNTADSDANGSGDGGGVSNSGPVAHLRNGLLAGNTDSDGQSPDCEGTLTSVGYNLLGNNAGCTFSAAAGDQVGTAASPIDPLLGPLRDNGGQTRTHALQKGSPAIDAGNPAGCADSSGALLVTDQRGAVRPSNGVCDIGSYEFTVMLVVDSSVDAVDADAGDGVCATASGECTLRAAIQEANALAGANMISLPAGTYTLTLHGSGEDEAASGDLDVRGKLLILGQGANRTIIDGDGRDRVFHLLFADLTLIGVTVQNGSVESTGGGAIYNLLGKLELIDSVVAESHSNSNGGGIYSVGAVSLTNSTVSGNSTNSNGGGILNAAASRLTLTNSTISGNSAGGDGGGVMNLPLGTASLTNGTISGNTAGSRGGGIYSGGVLTVTNTTMSGNASAPGPNGGGLYSSGTASLKNTIVANGPSGDNCTGAMMSAGHNLDSGNTCSFNAAGDIVNTDPLLGALRYNGGLTFTHALAANSPAVDAADDSACPATDQRGIARPQNDACDIGAYELETMLLSSTPTPTATATATPTGTVTATVTASPTATVTPTGDDHSDRDGDSDLDCHTERDCDSHCDRHAVGVPMRERRSRRRSW